MSMPGFSEEKSLYKSPVSYFVGPADFSTVQDAFITTQQVFNPLLERLRGLGPIWVYGSPEEIRACVERCNSFCRFECGDNPRCVECSRCYADCASAKTQATFYFNKFRGYW
ncbi:MAG: hypothetical protein F9K48_11060 [Candidatus Brocadia sp.]|nr:MAG: hypothetical protein F9K48_11060 [Candidatus Brocadia sp.]